MIVLVGFDLFSRLLIEQGTVAFPLVLGRCARGGITASAMVALITRTMFYNRNLKECVRVVYRVIVRCVALGVGEGEGGGGVSD